MKIILLSRAIYPFGGHGGMQKYAYYLGKYLQKRGADVMFITCGTETVTKKLHEFDGISYKFISPNVSGPFFHLKHQIFRINVANYLKKCDFDILHCFGGACLAYLFVKDRKPTILQPFGNEAFKESGIKRLINYAFFYHESKYLHTRVDAVASEGDIQTEEIIDLFGVNRDKIFTLSDGVDLSQIDNFIASSTMTREDTGLKKNDFVIITVNRLDSIKGLNYLIDAFNIIKREISNVKLLLIGAGPEERKLKNQIKNLGLGENVLHFKNVPDSLLFNYYSLADLYVSSSLQNCLLISVLEAMACGLPVVATDSQEGALKEEINGYIVQPRNSLAIADAVIKSFDRNELKRMGAKSKEIAKNYDWEIIAKKAIKEYERIIAGR